MNAKQADLVTRLETGWISIAELSAALGWKHHTIRARISGLRKSGVAVERRRIDGVTSYRVAPPPVEAAA